MVIVVSLKQDCNVTAAYASHNIHFCYWFSSLMLSGHRQNKSEEVPILAIIIVNVNFKGL